MLAAAEGRAPWWLASGVPLIIIGLTVVAIAIITEAIATHSASALI